jgi:hypothetical protein
VIQWACVAGLITLAMGEWRRRQAVQRYIHGKEVSNV